MEADVVAVRLSPDTSVALESFSRRVGVKREDVMSVMVGLAENERRERSGALVLAKLLMACEEALAEGELRSRVKKALDEFQPSALV